MRHTLAFNDRYGVYMCTVCGAGFTQDALIVEMDGTGCPGPSIETGYTVTMSVTRSPDYIPGEMHVSFYEFVPYEDCETKGRRLLKSAGYDDDEGGEI